MKALRRRTTSDWSEIQTLESRWAPAAVSVAGASLTIANQNGPLTVETTPVSGQIKITDNSGSQTLNGITRKITINGSDAADLISFRADTPVNQGFLGDLVVNAAAGSDIVKLSGKIFGNVTLNTAAGDDLVTSENNNVEIGGNFTYTDNFNGSSLQSNSIQFNGRDYHVSGNFNISGLTSFSMGAGSDLKVDGNLTFNGLGINSATNELFLDFDGSSLNVSGNLNITGTPLGDFITISPLTTISGNSTIDLGAGDNFFSFTPATGSPGFLGNHSYKGGAGPDELVFGPNATVEGNTAISLGEGINTFLDNTTSEYNGNFNLTAGSSANNVDMAGTVGRNLSITFGNGTGNSLNFSGSVGGVFKYRTGNGNLNTFNLTPSVPTGIFLIARFGSGSASFTLNAKLHLAGKVIGKGGSYSFLPNGALLNPSLKLIKFP